MSVHDFWLAGHQMTGFDMERGSLSVGIVRKFRQHFGVTPTICAEVWAILADLDYHPSHAVPRHLLCGLLFLKVYATEQILSSLSGLSEKTFRKWSKAYVDLLATEVFNVVVSFSFYDYFIISYYYAFFEL